MNDTNLIQGMRRRRGARALMGVVFFAILFAAPAHAQNCTFNSGNKTVAVTYAIPSTLNMPRDALLETVIWRSALHNLTRPANRYSCKRAARVGVRNVVGGSPITKTNFPIGDTGLAWSVTRIRENGFDMLAMSDVSVADKEPAGTHNLDGTSFQVTIVKIGEVSAGATIPAGVLGHYSIDQEIDAVTFSTSNRASVGMASCMTPDVTVRMGDKNSVGQLKGVGTSLAPVNFSIALKGCPTVIKKLVYLLKPNTKIVDAARSVVELDAASTAKGVGLQILNKHGNPVALNERIIYEGYNDAWGGNFNIPLKAAYYQTAAEVEPGTANSSVAFVMSYQ